MHHLDVPATISKLHYIISKASTATDGELSTTTSSSVTQTHAQPQAQRPRFLTGGVTAAVDITLNDRICMENFVDCRPLGRFVLRKSGETIAVGVIDAVL
jgi:elongation factor 1 alpha-like protein